MTLHPIHSSFAQCHHVLPCCEPLLPSSHCGSVLGFEPLPQCSDINWREEKKRKKKNPNKLRRPMRGPVSLSLSLSLSRPSCHRENADVILEITLLKINVGLEKCVIVP